MISYYYQLSIVTISWHPDRKFPIILNPLSLIVFFWPLSLKSPGQLQLGPSVYLGSSVQHNLFQRMITRSGLNLFSDKLENYCFLKFSYSYLSNDRGRCLTCLQLITADWFFGENWRTTIYFTIQQTNKQQNK